MCPSLWPHQQFALDEVAAAIVRGERKICVTSPTGTGKTMMMSQLIEQWCEQGLKTAIYSNRKLLIEQTSRVMARAGIDHGIRSAGYGDDDRFEPVQICSLQTEDSRVLKQGRWRLHDADRVLVDECHQATGAVARKILETHYEEGAAYIGFSATPIDLGILYETLITACTTSQGRECGALIPCLHYGPDEPDLKHIGKIVLGQDLTQKQQIKAIMTHGIFGRVFEWYERLNPEHRPTILFAPGVAESVWFAEQFHNSGISAAHIDGEEVWINGEFYKSDRKAREQVLAGSHDGSIKVICNRFVLREGIDAPWLAHGIFATVFGSLQSYLQSGGRLLRAYPGMDSVSLQDHGGNWHRHGSLNADREWHLDDTPAIVAGLREDRLRAKKIAEPVRCPQCAKILHSPRCGCGWTLSKSQKKSRPVIQADGTLKEMKGDIFRPRRISNRSDAEQIWRRVYYRAKKAGLSFRQAEALFAKENHWGWPPKTLPLMPTQEKDWWRKVAEVPPERLTR
jgi:superfamily II DNA or RNA helicase